MTEYAELRAALAAGPTPGPWAWGADSRIATVARVSDYRIGPDHGTSYEAHYEFHAPDHVDAAYAAAAHPATIAALLAERDALAAMSDAARDVIAERARQMSVEGWTPEHDDEHADESLAIAAVCYVLFGDSPNSPNHPPSAWPWAAEWWKPKDHRRNLVRATALLIAELERRDRADAAMAEREGDG